MRLFAGGGQGALRSRKRCQQSLGERLERRVTGNNRRIERRSRIPTALFRDGVDGTLAGNRPTSRIETAGHLFFLLPKGSVRVRAHSPQVIH